MYRIQESKLRKQSDGHETYAVKESVPRMFARASPFIRVMHKKKFAVM